MLEVLKIRREKCFDRYMRLHSRATSPRCALNTDGTPRTRGGSYTNETLILNAAEALAKYNKATEQYDAFYNQLETGLSELEKISWREREALEVIFIDNQGRPREERQNGLCRALGVRTRSECGPIIRAAKEHLTEILRSQGVPIEN